MSEKQVYDCLIRGTKKEGKKEREREKPKERMKEPKGKRDRLKERREALNRRVRQTDRMQDKQGVT